MVVYVGPSGYEPKVGKPACGLRQVSPFLASGSATEICLGSLIRVGLSFTVGALIIRIEFP